MVAKGNWVWLAMSTPKKVDKIIEGTMRFQPDGYQHSEKYKEGKWDGFINLFSWWDRKFPRGLLDDVLLLLAAKNITFRLDVADKDREWDTLTTEFNGPTLRSEQENAVEEAINAERGIINLPTGAGKSLVGYAIIHELNLPTVIYVNKLEIAKQWRDGVKDVLGCEAGSIGDGKYEFNPITVAMVQSVSRLPKELFNDYAITIFDECHHEPANTVYEIAMATKSKYIFGLTATPFREDGKDLMLKAGIGPILIKRTTSEMIKQGRLAKPTIYMVEMPVTATKSNAKYAEVYRDVIIDNNRRNDIILDIAEHYKDRRTYIHVKQIRHGKLLEDMIEGSVFIYGDDLTKKRTKALEAFSNGELKVLISTLLGEGVDIPDMEVLILAGGGLSEVMVRQVIGRVLRITEKKKEVVIVDFIDKSRYLFRHSLTRQDIYKSEEEFEVRTWEKK